MIFPINECQRLCVMKSCVFDNEEFPTEILKLAKKRQLLVQLKIAIFYTRLKFAIHKFNNNLKEQKRGLRLVYTEKNLLRQH